MGLALWVPGEVLVAEYSDEVLLRRQEVLLVELLGQGSRVEIKCDKFNLIRLCHSMTINCILKIELIDIEGSRRLLKLCKG